MGDSSDRPISIQGCHSATVRSEKRKISVIAFHDVMKLVGPQAKATLVLAGLNWAIPARSRITILGQPGSGKTTLLQLMAGSSLPTRGWVERRGIVSSSGSLTFYATGRTTAAQLVHHLALLFRADPKELTAFVEAFADLQGQMNRPVSRLGRSPRQNLGLGLFYGLPCDFYLFDDRVSMGRGHVMGRAKDAFQSRSQDAGMILATSDLRIARKFGGDGAILHRGELTLFRTLEEAISEFEYVCRVDPVHKHAAAGRKRDEPEDDEYMLDA